MVTSSIKFWKAMEKFDVSRSLFCVKSSKVQKLLYMNSHSTLIVYSLFSNSKYKNSAVISTEAQRNGEISINNLSQRIRKFKVQKVVLQRSPFLLSSLPVWLRYDCSFVAITQPPLNTSRFKSCCTVKSHSKFKKAP